MSDQPPSYQPPNYPPPGYPPPNYPPPGYPPPNYPPPGYPPPNYPPSAYVQPAETYRATASGSNVSAIISLIAGLIPILSIGVNILVAVLRLPAFISGFLSLLSLPAILTAIITGHIGVAFAGRFAPGKGYRGLAIAGLVLGYLEILLIILAIVLIIVAIRNFS